jgi:hypothetical protein
LLLFAAKYRDLRNWVIDEEPGTEAFSYNWEGSLGHFIFDFRDKHCGVKLPQNDAGNVYESNFPHP